MTDRAPERCGAAAAALVAAAAVVLVLGARRGASEERRAAEFQRLAGGIGAGTATGLAPCDAAFDPAAGGSCARGLDPVPGGFAFCPHHAGPSLRR